MKYVTVKNNLPSYREKSVAGARVAVRRMAADIVGLSKTQVPYDKGRLSKSQELRQEGSNTWIISFATPYARWWEFNQTHPIYGTPVHFKNNRKSHYLSDPTSSVGTKANSYFVGVLG